MPYIGVIVDDLTGATTTGVLLARSGTKTTVFFNVEAAKTNINSSSLDAILISSNSRALPPDEAYEKVSDAIKTLQSMNVSFFSKRIDTTMRGGIGVEIDAMLDYMNEGTVAVVVPAMPQSKRILVGGYSIIDSVALVDTPVAQDVRTPVLENYIPKLLDGQSRRKIGCVTLESILSGKIETKKALKTARHNGADIIVVDAVTLDHIELIAKACLELKWNILAVDPGPFTSKLAFCRKLIHEEKDNIPIETADETGKFVLIAAGSATPVTKKQMEVLCQDNRNKRISINPISLIDGGDVALAEIDITLNHVRSVFENENPRVILLETALHDELLNLDIEDKKRGYASGMSANRINSGLGNIVAKIIEDLGHDKIAGIYTTGGDTMVNVCYQLEAECIEVLDYVIPQTDICRMLGKYQGMPIIGKGGLTGNESIVLDIVDRLFKESSRITK
ncbi:four-carbon acid sugar kinase family protein [Lachnoanaerobaculum orale]|uniref:four-carbon acid sugar kinase family protein n=1 Tax=Lachnoanaerobaculum orale TaxID=979627 RepID=UPI0023A7EEFC|nr:four-carbon acid sugar kinase family protein [Lachnoanaerobaculum orale]